MFKVADSVIIKNTQMYLSSSGGYRKDGYLDDESKDIRGVVIHVDSDMVYVKFKPIKRKKSNIDDYRRDYLVLPYKADNLLLATPSDISFYKQLTN